MPDEAGVDLAGLAAQHPVRAAPLAALGRVQRCALCRTHRLTIYDALPLDLALRAGATLATRDTPLARAATAERIHVL